MAKDCYTVKFNNYIIIMVKRSVCWIAILRQVWSLSPYRAIVNHGNGSKPRSSHISGAHNIHTGRLVATVRRSCNGKVKTSHY